jgi:hypothetical protein
LVLLVWPDQHSPGRHFDFNNAGKKHHSAFGLSCQVTLEFASVPQIH